VLGVQHGASLEDVKKAYRDLVQVWHPDRFGSNERLQAKAAEQLREINLAWEYLAANAFQNGVLLDPAENESAVVPATPAAASPQQQAHSVPPAGPGDAATPAGSAQEAEIPAAPRRSFWGLILAALILLGCGLAWYLRSHSSSIPVSKSEGTAAGPAEVPVPSDHAREQAAPAPTPAPAKSLYAFSSNILPDMTTTNGLDWLQSTHLLSPPFAIRVRLKLAELVEVPLRYGLGSVIFNWRDHPNDLRVLDPRDSGFTPVPGKGLLLPNDTHDLVWDIARDKMTVTLDGQTRYEGAGDFNNIKAFIGIRPDEKSVSLESFVLETPASLTDVPAPPPDHEPMPGDILSRLVPENNVRVTRESDGLALRNAGGEGIRLMSPGTFQPPFIIAARAKTDAWNLLLHCGPGKLIFNWDRNVQELRVHDPLNGQQTPVTGKGLISPNEWHTFTWNIKNTGMKVYVDGQLRFQNRKDYHTLDAKVGIGPALSKVTVDYFVVRKN
jgi:DnaJ domain